MPALRLCQSCAGPRPRAAVRCPWCLASYTSPSRIPEHLFATAEGEKGVEPQGYPPAAHRRR
jgi:hypothetical protein